MERGKRGRMSECAWRARRRFPRRGRSLKRIYGGVPPTAAFSGGAGRERGGRGEDARGDGAGPRMPGAEPRPRLVSSPTSGMAPRNRGAAWCLNQLAFA